MFSEPNKRKQKWLFCPPTTPSPSMEGGSLGGKNQLMSHFLKKAMARIEPQWLVTTDHIFPLTML